MLKSVKLLLISIIFLLSFTSVSATDNNQIVSFSPVVIDSLSVADMQAAVFSEYKYFIETNQSKAENFAITDNVKSKSPNKPNIQFSYDVGLLAESFSKKFFRSDVGFGVDKIIVFGAEAAITGFKTSADKPGNGLKYKRCPVPWFVVRQEVNKDFKVTNQIPYSAYS